MAETFPLPRSGLKLLRLILIGYLHEGGNERKPTGPSAVGATVGLDQTIVSRNNAFLAAVNLIEPAENRRWRLTEPGVDVARAFEYEAQDELEQSLNSLLRSNEFVRRILAFVRGRGGVEHEQVVSHMARLAGVRKTSDFLTGARALLELMSEAGLVERDGEFVRVAAPREAPPDRAEQPATRRRRSSPGASFPDLAETAARHAVASPGLILNLNVSVDASKLSSDAAADALAARIRRLLDALAADAER